MAKKKKQPLFTPANRAFLKSIASEIGKFTGDTFVLKIGGEVLEKTLDPLAEEIAMFYCMGMRLVVVHGGGTRISYRQKQLGLKPRFVHGLRVTDEETLDRVVRPVMAEVNSEIVETLNSKIAEVLDEYGDYAISLQKSQGGKKPDLIIATKRDPEPVEVDGKKTYVDLGLVGKVEGVHTDTLYRLLNQGYIPVISSLGMDSQGVICNINADEVAGGVAARIDTDKLVVLTDVRGVYGQVTRRGYSSFISYMDTERAKSLIKEETVTKGMIPKLDACIYACENGVYRAHIVKGTDKDSFLKEVLGPGTGTMIASPHGIKEYEMELKRKQRRR